MTMRHMRLAAVALLAGGLAAGEAAARNAAISPSLQSLLATARPDQDIDVIIVKRNSQALETDLRDIRLQRQDRARSGRKADRRQRRAERRGMLQALRREGDGALKRMSDRLRGRFQRGDPKQLWIINGVAATVRAGDIGELAVEDDIAEIRLDGTVTSPPAALQAESPATWNIDMVNAPALWAQGQTGAGEVVAIMDSGVDADHADLAARWRGGGNSWFDPNGEHATPYDSIGHGTGVMGVAVGGDAGGSTIGVAPGAQWIAVKIFDDAGNANFSAIHQGFQWLLDPDGDPATDDAPSVVINSWTLSAPLGGCDPEFMTDIQLLKQLDIGVVFSAGNYGPGGATNTSPANYPDSFAIGSVDFTALVASSSSRGPSACGGRPYPDMVAPGVQVYSADLTFGGLFPTSYNYLSGSSFAAPHAGGAMALLRGAYPDASVADLEAALKAGAYDVDVQGVDDASGAGLLDLAAAEAFLAAGGTGDGGAGGGGTGGGGAGGGDPGPDPDPDADADGYTASVDCDDADPAVNPGASEVASDGVDQDCDGFDLTIRVRAANYIAAKDRLVVRASSDYGAAAALEVVGYGPMTWNAAKNLWIFNQRRVGGDPGVVIVSGPEGDMTRATRLK